MNYAGVELGGTKCVAILARGPIDILARKTIRTSSPDATLGEIAETLSSWQSGEGFGALGIASFGPIELDRNSPTFGRLSATPKLHWAGTDVLGPLQRAAGVTTFLHTDVVGAAIAEMRWGIGHGLTDFAYITVGTGVGVGLIVNGLPTTGFAHCELGHIRVARLPGDQWPGTCPFHGDCVEGLASGPSIIARLGSRAIEDLLPDEEIWDSVSFALAQLCQAIVCAAAPRRIAIGGGVIENNPHLVERVEEILFQSLNGYVRIPDRGSYLQMPALGPDAGPLGAIAIAMGSGASGNQ